MIQKGNTMHFNDYLHNQLKLHPFMQPQDIVKLCYQAAFGAEHLLRDISAAKKYFFTEYNKTPCCDGMLYEEISPYVCRIHLGAWKKSGMPADWLFCMFVNSSHVSPNGAELLKEYLGIADKFVKTQLPSFPLEEWKKYLEKYQELGMPSVHHSQIYHETEHPAYRIVHKHFIRLLPILQKAALFQNKTGSNIIAIDGRAASGKSTMANDLKLILDGSIVHVDDFFLPPELRTIERFSEPGGNVHYERFKSDIIPFLSHKNPFSYRVFDCSKMDYGTYHFVEESKWRIVEGAYSHHPYFGEYADIKVFSDITPEKQMDRILKRNGAWLAERFRNEWIPLEESYYKYYKIKEKSDIVISAI